MSTIKIEFLSEDKNEIAQLLNALAGINTNTKSVESIEVTDAEVLTKVEAPAKAKRASRAKAEPTPVVDEPEAEEAEEIDDLDDDLEDDVELDEESIDADDIRAVQAAKVDKHREAIKAELKKLGASGIRDLDEKHYQKYYDFLSKLK